MNSSPNQTVDRILEAAALAVDAAEWGIDSLADAGLYSDEHVELEVIDDRHHSLARALRAFATYSDGRPIRGHIDVDHGATVVGCVWPAVPAAEGEQVLIESRLSTDPGDPDRGGYRVWADRRTCTLRVEYLPAAPRLVCL